MAGNKIKIPIKIGRGYRASRLISLYTRNFDEINDTLHTYVVNRNFNTRVYDKLVLASVSNYSYIKNTSFTKTTDKILADHTGNDLILYTH